MIIEPNELIVLMLLLLGVVPVALSFIKYTMTKYLFIAYSCLLLGAFFTIFETAVYPELLNFLEHFIGVAVAGIFFFLCAYFSYNRMHIIEKEVVTKTKRGKS